MRSAALAFALCFAAPAPQENAVRPQTPPEEQVSFHVPDGFVAELVAAEPDTPKIVDIAFDDRGRMWAITAVEYPVDGNENAGAAELYKRGGRDRVLVFDTPCAEGRQTPRVFADGLAMPMAVLPLDGERDAALIGDGPEIFRLTDTDGDGRADKRETVLSGFGIEDSHLLPHRFTRAPGGWILMAQGAFNYSKVKTRPGATVEFNQCKLARFRADGSEFEVIGTGLNNIWGIVVDRFGETWIQEANDMGYPVVRCRVGESFPGIGDHRAKPYAPFAPAPADFAMGGTGLSGLALCEGQFPPQWNDVMFVANPIVRAVQAVRIRRDGAHYKLEKLADFMTTADGMFRPIAAHFGPDGALYVVDWYCKIISHNEVPRNHPDRDKIYGRVWRVRPKDASRRVTDVARASAEELPELMRSREPWVGRAAARQAGLRASVEALMAIEKNAKEGPVVRLRAAWALEDRVTAKEKEFGRAYLREVDEKGAPLHDIAAEFVLVNTIDRFLKSRDRTLRREAVRLAAFGSDSSEGVVNLLKDLPDESDAEIRIEAVHTLALTAPDDDSTALLLQFGAHGEGYDREFEAYSVRAALENRLDRVRALLDRADEPLSPAARRTALAALPADEAGRRVAALKPAALEPSDVEFLARAAADKNVIAFFVSKLAAAPWSDERARAAALDALAEHAPAVAPEPAAAAALDSAVESIEKNQPSALGPRTLLGLAKKLHSAAALRLLERVAEDERAPRDVRTETVRNLAAAGCGSAALFSNIGRRCVPGDPLLAACADALAQSAAPGAPAALLTLWPGLSGAHRKQLTARLAASPDGAHLLLEKLDSGEISKDAIDADILLRLRAVLGPDPALAALEKELESRLQLVLELGGADADYLAAPVDLRGPFTVETWVKLEPGITNEDGVLGEPGGADLNFADGLFRVYGGPGAGDFVIAKRRVEAGVWTHVAATRGASGQFRIYINGELSAESERRSTADFLGLHPGRTTPPRAGTHGRFFEYRVWDAERSAQEIGSAFQRSLDAAPHLIHKLPAKDGWGAGHGAARAVRTADAPALLDDTEAAALDAKLDKYRTLLAEGGDAAHGRELFAKTCMTCHTVHKEGGRVGPVLDGAGWMNREALLRSIVTPSAAMEPGYRAIRIVTDKNELLDGLVVSQDDASVTLRRPNTDDLRIPRTSILSMQHTMLSVMPSGLLEGMNDRDAHDLLSYVRGLK